MVKSTHKTTTIDYIYNVLSSRQICFYCLQKNSEKVHMLINHTLAQMKKCPTCYVFYGINISQVKLRNSLASYYSDEIFVSLKIVI